MLFECMKCGHIMNSTSTKPRCSKCNSVHLEIYDALAKVENTIKPTTEPILSITDKDFKSKMNSRILDHFDKMSSIQLLNAMSQGIVTKSPAAQEQENKMAGDIIDSLKQSNETLVDSLADKQSEEQQAQQAQLEQKPDEMGQIIEFAKNNPDIVKQFLGNLDKKE